MSAVALFGLYPRLPAAIRDHGNQPGFAGGHCIYVQRRSVAFVPGFLSEFDHEPGVVADCVPASGVRGVNYQTRGRKAPCTYTEREALQNAMGTQDVGANEAQLATGIQKRYGLADSRGQGWAAIQAAIGPLSTPVIVGDPLAWGDTTAVIGDLRAFADGLQDRYVLFPDPPTPSLVAAVGPGTVTAFHVLRGTRTLIGSKTVTFTRSGTPIPVSQGYAGYYLVHEGPFAGLYLVAGKSGPFTVRNA
ncbi:MAG TPA: hypothetical protein VK600_00335 [Candidatus Saccharimonadales bacterium]|nr:hypothetical protein [Candidatus Saccharimonadales bacterium]